MRGSWSKRRTAERTSAALTSGARGRFSRSSHRAWILVSLCDEVLRDGRLDVEHELLAGARLAGQDGALLHEVNLDPAALHQLAHRRQVRHVAREPVGLLDEQRPAARRPPEEVHDHLAAHVHEEAASFRPVLPAVGVRQLRIRDGFKGSVYGRQASAWPGTYPRAHDLPSFGLRRLLGASRQSNGGMFPYAISSRCIAWTTRMSSIGCLAQLGTTSTELPGCGAPSPS